MRLKKRSGNRQLEAPTVAAKNLPGSVAFASSRLWTIPSCEYRRHFHQTRHCNRNNILSTWSQAKLPIATDQVEPMRQKDLPPRQGDWYHPCRQASQCPFQHAQGGCMSQELPVPRGRTNDSSATTTRNGVETQKMAPCVAPPPARPSRPPSTPHHANMLSPQSFSRER